MMAELILWAALMGKDCRFLNHYSSDPNRRMQELMYESENTRTIQGEAERFWMNDQPLHLTPGRTHGGARNGESSQVQLPPPPGSGRAPSPDTTKRKTFTIRFTF